MENPETKRDTASWMGETTGRSYQQKEYQQHHHQQQQKKYHHLHLRHHRLGVRMLPHCCPPTQTPQSRRCCGKAEINARLSVETTWWCEHRKTLGAGGIGQGKKLDMDNEAQWDLVSLFLSISHSILSLTLSWYLAWEKKLAMIVVYRQRSGSQRFKPEERQTAFVAGAAGAAAAAATANNGDSQKKQKGRMDGWRGDGTCVWVVGVCVTQAASIAWWGRKETQPRKRTITSGGGCGCGCEWEWMDGWVDMGRNIVI